MYNFFYITKIPWRKYFINIAENDVRCHNLLVTLLEYLIHLLQVIRYRAFTTVMLRSFTAIAQTHLIFMSLSQSNDGTYWTDFKILGLLYALSSIAIILTTKLKEHKYHKTDYKSKRFAWYNGIKVLPPLISVNSFICWN